MREEEGGKRKMVSFLSASLLTSAILSFVIKNQAHTKTALVYLFVKKHSPPSPLSVLSTSASSKVSLFSPVAIRRHSQKT